MKKSSRVGKKQLGIYAKAALSFLGRAAASGIIFAFSSLGEMIEDFDTYNRYGANYIGRRRSYSKKSMHQAVSRLTKRGYVRVVARGDELYLRLTAAGKSAIENLHVEELKVSRPRTWDRKWHLVAFDIPEDQKSVREAFRRRLIGFGFTKVEKSLFAIPYPCEKEIARLTEYFSIGPYVHYITAMSFNGDHRLRAVYEFA